MNPALLNYMMQVQQQQQGQPQPDSGIAHPFQSGISMAMNAARQSLTPRDPEQQSRNALGRGIISFGQSMGQPHENKLAGLNQALGSGINSYLQEREMQDQQEQQMNAMIYAQAVREKENEIAHQRKAEEAELDRELRRDQLSQQMMMHEQELGESRRAHDLAHHDRSSLMQLRNSLGKQQESPEEVSEGNKGLYGVEYVPFKTKTQQSEFDKAARKELGTLDVNKRALKSIEKMKKIFDKYPNIGTSFLNMLEEGKEGESGFWGYLGKMFTNEKERTAIQELRKNTADLQLDTVLGMQGKSATDLLKRAIQAASPTGKLTHEAFNDIAKEWEERAHHNIKRIKVVEDAQKRGMMPLFTTMEEGGLDQEFSPQMQEQSNDLSSLSDEELERIANQ